MYEIMAKKRQRSWRWLSGSGKFVGSNAWQIRTRIGSSMLLEYKSVHEMNFCHQNTLELKCIKT